jgi:hypothetical protein
MTTINHLFPYYNVHWRAHHAKGFTLFKDLQNNVSTIISAILEMRNEALPGSGHFQGTTANK